MNESYIKFADIKKVIIDSFEFHSIYAGLLVGSKHDVTEHLIAGYPESIPNGTYFKLDDECFVPNDSLSQEEWLATRKFRPFRYCMKVHDFYCDGQLTIHWIDFAPPQDMSLHDYIEKRTSVINYYDYAEAINW